MFPSLLKTICLHPGHLTLNIGCGPYRLLTIYTIDPPTFEYILEKIAILDDQRFFEEKKAWFVNTENPKFQTHHPRFVFCSKTTFMILGICICLPVFLKSAKGETFGILQTVYFTHLILRKEMAS